MKPNVLCVIPARGGSKGLPRKNVRPLAGKPLLAHTILQAQACALIDRLVVSTDDEEIAGVARAYGAEVPFIRPAAFATDTARTDEVLQHAVGALDEAGFVSDIVVWMHVNMVFRKPAWITQAVRNLIDSPDAESSFALCSTHKHYWFRQNGHYERLLPEGEPVVYAQRQKQTPIFREECGLVCATRADIVRSGRRVGRRAVPVVVDEELATHDIHDAFDLWVADKILTEWSEGIWKS